MPKDSYDEVSTSTTFEAGRLKKFSNFWKEITSDDKIIDIIENCHLEFKDGILPCQEKLQHEIKFNDEEIKIIDEQIKKLIEYKAIIEVDKAEEQFISTIFIRPKKNGENRVIFNLKDLNEHIEYHHFKMDTLESAVNLLSKGCWMSSVDILNGKENFSVHLLTIWFVISTKSFYKIIKTSICHSLRSERCSVMGYIDDCLILGDTREECLYNTERL